MTKKHRESLVSYLETPILNMKWIIEVLKGCSLEEFDQHVASLEEEFGYFVRWRHIPDIRRELSKIRFTA